MTDQKREDYLEVLLEPVIMAATYMADDARPLAEMTATAKCKESVPFEMRKCPYPHSRNGKSMNVSALRILSLGMKACINDTIRLRRAYLKREKRSSFDLPSFWRFTRTLDSLPAYLTRRAHGALDDQSLPSRVSTMFKAAQGLHLAPEVMLFDSVPLSTPITTDGLMDLIESRDLFMDDGRACAGPPVMVQEFVDSAVTGRGADLEEDWMFQILEEPEAAGLFAYADAVSDVFVAKALFEAESRAAVGQVLRRVELPELAKAAEDSAHRFGFYRDRDQEQLQAAMATLRELTKLPSIDEPQLRPVPREFLDVICRRNNQMPEQQVKEAGTALWAAIAHEGKWLRTFESCQSKVLHSLGRNKAGMQLSSRDLEGTGYTPREVLSTALHVELVHGPTVCVMRAGASSMTFDLL